MHHHYVFYLQVEIEGLTGEIRFSEEGRRQNYTLNVVEMSVSSGVVKVAEWSDEGGFMPLAAKYMRAHPRGVYEKNQTYVVTTILEEPYLMMRKTKVGERYHGKDLYEGYCKDLAELLAKQLNINCEYAIATRWWSVPRMEIMDWLLLNF